MWNVYCEGNNWIPWRKDLFVRTSDIFSPADGVSNIVKNIEIQFQSLLETILFSLPCEAIMNGGECTIIRSQRPMVTESGAFV